MTFSGVSESLHEHTNIGPLALQSPRYAQNCDLRGFRGFRVKPSDRMSTVLLNTAESSGQHCNRTS